MAALGAEPGGAGNESCEFDEPVEFVVPASKWPPPVGFKRFEDSFFVSRSSLMWIGDDVW